MKLGIFGGTFDPIHYGHLMLAEACRQELNLDQILFIPAGNPPHKAGEISDGHARADMVGLAISGLPEFSVDRREIRRAGPSFSVLTLEEVAQEQPDADLFFLIGVYLHFDGEQDRAGKFFRRASALSGTDNAHLIAFLKSDEKQQLEFALNFHIRKSLCDQQSFRLFFIWC